MITAIEWLANELYTKFEMRGNGNLFDEILKQAKEMEKKQIIYAWYIGVENEGKKHSYTYLWGRIDLAKEYYNETFKK